MYMLEIAAFDNGAHRNQTYHGNLPDGWAVIPDDMICENFPFGEVAVAEVKGVPTVTSWIPGVMPDPTPDPDPEPSLEEQVAELTKLVNILAGGEA